MTWATRTPGKQGFSFRNNWLNCDVERIFVLLALRERWNHKIEIVALVHGDKDFSRSLETKTGPKRPRSIYVSIAVSVQNLAEEQPGALMLRIVEEFGGRILFDDLALVHEDDAVCDLTGKAHFVGYA